MRVLTPLQRCASSAGCLAALLACNGARPDTPPRPPPTHPASMATAPGPAWSTPAAAHGTVVPLRAPSDSEIPAGPLGESIRRGHALLAATADSLPKQVRSRLRCLSCHLDDGRRANASPLVGVSARYPTYSARTGRAYTIEDRINDCFRRSLNGRALPADGSDMRDVVVYLAWISRGVPIGASVQGQGLRTLTPLIGDTARGRAIFTQQCTRCHGADGSGTVVAPPLWGSRSFNIGAGMARLRTAAAFIRDNMPFDRPGSLNDQQAFDAAAFIVSRPRPDFPGKENDWPNGWAPPDVAYATRGASRKN